MNMLKVESSQIEAMGFDGTILKVSFKTGGVYTYENVTQELFDQIMNAPSVGGTFSSLIKKHPTDYPYKKV